VDGLSALRAGTDFYIHTAPVSIILTPVTKVKTGNGSTPTPGTPRVAQTFKVNEPSDSNRRAPTNAGNGKQRDHDFILVGHHDAAIEVDDRLTLNGKEFEVIELLTPNGYETRALVVRRGW